MDHDTCMRFIDQVKSSPVLHKRAKNLRMQKEQILKWVLIAHQFNFPNYTNARKFWNVIVKKYKYELLHGLNIMTHKLSFMQEIIFSGDQAMDLEADVEIDENKLLEALNSDGELSIALENAKLTDTNEKVQILANVDVTNIDATNIDATNVDASTVDASNVDATNVDASNVDATNVIANYSDEMMKNKALIDNFENQNLEYIVVDNGDNVESIVDDYEHLIDFKENSSETDVNNLNYDGDEDFVIETICDDYIEIQQENVEEENASTLISKNNTIESFDDYRMLSMNEEQNQQQEVQKQNQQVEKQQQQMPCDYLENRKRNSTEIPQPLMQNKISKRVITTAGIITEYDTISSQNPAVATPPLPLANTENIIKNVVVADENTGAITKVVNNKPTLSNGKSNNIVGKSPPPPNIDKFTSTQLVFLSYAKSLESMPFELQINVKRKINKIMEAAELLMLKLQQENN